jgi:membrane-associated phospholipid phosphatase
MVEPALQPVRVPPLIADRWRRAAITLIAVAVAGLVALSVAFSDDRRPSAFDSWAVQRLYAHVGPNLARAMLGATEPLLTLSVCVLVAVVALAYRRWDIAAVTVVAPIAAVVLSEVILKPIIGRRLSFSVHERLITIPGYAFPSGHETGLTSLTAECALLVLRAPISAAKRGVAVSLLGVWTVIGALGLVRNGYHYVTDTVGGICVSIICVFGIALLVDAIAAAIGRSRAAG